MRCDSEELDRSLFVVPPHPDHAETTHRKVRDVWGTRHH
jgi:hypothetical protein